MERQILKQITLDWSKHKSTGATRHFVGKEQVNSKISHLKIIKYSNSEGYYLLYFNSNGDELTDTYHSSLVDALHQAEFEFGMKPEDWSES